MFHVIVTQTGPSFDPSLPLERQSEWEEHAEFMEALVDDGFIVLGGPLDDGTQRVVLAIEAASEEEIRDRLGADPWSDSHLVLEAIEPWTIRLDGR
jgi:uncharacterized protein YciI